MRLGVAVVLAAGALWAARPSVARADCETQLQALEQQAAAAPAARTRQLVQYDVDRARKESAEGDEGECQEAIDHATRLLTQR